MTAFIGNIVVVVFDTSDPRNPQIISSKTTTMQPGFGGGSAIIGTNLFLFGGNEDANGNISAAAARDARQRR